MKKYIIFCILLIISAGARVVGQERTVLFICAHGATKSPLATAYFNKYAEEKKLPWRAIFRAAHTPNSNLNPRIKNGLIQDGFAIMNWCPKALTEEDVNGAERVVAIDVLLPGSGSLSKPLDLWNVFPTEGSYEDLTEESYKELRGILDRKVKVLIENIDNQFSKSGTQKKVEPIK